MSDALRRLTRLSLVLPALGDDGYWLSRRLAKLQRGEDPDWGLPKPGERRRHHRDAILRVLSTQYEGRVLRRAERLASEIRRYQSARGRHALPHDASGFRVLLHSVANMEVPDVRQLRRILAMEPPYRWPPPWPTLDTISGLGGGRCKGKAMNNANVVLRFREDLTLMLSCGEDAIELQLNPEQAMDLVASILVNTANAMGSTVDDAAGALGLLVMHASGRGGTKTWSN